jgi:hypothetical protein
MKQAVPLMFDAAALCCVRASKAAHLQMRLLAAL